MCLFSTAKTRNDLRNWDDPPRTVSKWSTQDATVTLPAGRSRSTHRRSQSQVRRSHSQVRRSHSHVRRTSRHYDYENTAQIVRRMPSRDVERRVSRHYDDEVIQVPSREIVRVPRPVVMPVVGREAVEQRYLQYPEVRAAPEFIAPEFVAPAVEPIPVNVIHREPRFF